MVREAFLSRAALHLENLALRQQLAALDRKGARPSLRMADRLFWVVLSRLWSGWRDILVIVKPETVIGWHRKGFRRFWTRKSRRGKPGRPPVSSEFRGLIRRMSRENPLWGAPRIHGELRMLGFEVSEAAVSKLSLLFTPSGAETLVFWVSQPLAWLVAPKDVLLMTRRGDLKLSHGATAKARENAVKQDRVQTTNAIKSP